MSKPLEKAVRTQIVTPEKVLKAEQMGLLLKEIFLIFEPNLPIEQAFFETFTSDDNSRIETFLNPNNQGFRFDVMSDESDWRDPCSFYFNFELVGIEGYELHWDAFYEYGGWSNRGKFGAGRTLTLRSTGSQEDLEKKFAQILAVAKRYQVEVRA